MSKSDDRIYQPHDALFKAYFSDPQTAASEFRAVLPAALAEKVDWESLALESGSGVDDLLSQYHTDLLFTATLGDSEALFYLVFEHQRSEDPLIEHVRSSVLGLRRL